jgi:hypothetical protein
VAAGEQSLRQQMVQLRSGTAFAMLHAAGLDSAAQPWVMQGIAEFAGRQGVEQDVLKSAASEQSATRFGGQQWRYQRAAVDLLDYPQEEAKAAHDRIAFLLTGDDGEHAPALLAHLRYIDSEARTNASTGAGFRKFGGDPQPAAISSSLEELVGGLTAQFDKWKEQPLVGQPVFEPTAGVAAEILAAEQEMLVLLKLQRRMAKSNAVALRTKVATFDRERREVVASSAKAAAAPSSFDLWAGSLMENTQQPWATLDVDGSLLLATDAGRVGELLANADGRYTWKQLAEHVALERRIDEYRFVRGWFEENAKDKSRPLAKFEVVDNRAKKARTGVGPISLRPRVSEFRR